MLEKSKELTIPKGAEVVLLDEIISYDPARVDNKKLAEIRKSALDIDPLYVNFTSGSTDLSLSSSAISLRFLESEAAIFWAIRPHLTLMFR